MGLFGICCDRMSQFKACLPVCCDNLSQTTLIFLKPTLISLNLYFGTADAQCSGMLKPATEERNRKMTNKEWHIERAKWIERVAAKLKGERLKSNLNAVASDHRQASEALK